MGSKCWLPLFTVKVLWILKIQVDSELPSERKWFRSKSRKCLINLQWFSALLWFRISVSISQKLYIHFPKNEHSCTSLHIISAYNVTFLMTLPASLSQIALLHHHTHTQCPFLLPCFMFSHYLHGRVSQSEVPGPPLSHQDTQDGTQNLHFQRLPEFLLNTEVWESVGWVTGFLIQNVQGENLLLSLLGHLLACPVLALQMEIHLPQHMSGLG